MQVPTWVRPPARAVLDFHRLARVYAAYRPDDHAAAARFAAVGMVLETGMTEDSALAEMNRAVAVRSDPRAGAAAGALADTMAWLVGLLSRAPFAIPRRHPDGRLVTADDLYAEREAAAPAPWEPERRDAERAAARKQAARYRALAELAEQV